MKGLFTLFVFILIPFYSSAEESIITPAPDAKGILYVKQNADETGDGSSWSKALPSFADALDYAEKENRKKPRTVKQIWVAKGTYIPAYKYADKDYDGNATTENDNTFLITSGIELYGGFSGIETSLEERSPRENETILSGKLDTLSNAYHVVTIFLPEGSVVLDGFTITEGNSSMRGSWVGISDVYDIRRTNGNDIGANIYRGNGGGIYADLFDRTSIEGTGNAGVQLRVSNNIITKNKSDSNGGGAWIHGKVGGYIDKSKPSSVIIEDNIIIDNEGFSGGGIYFSASFHIKKYGDHTVISSTNTSFSYKLSRNIISGNEGYTGGGMFVGAIGGSRIYVENNEVSGNRSMSDGSGIAASSGSGPACIYLTNNTVANNILDANFYGNGGGIYATSLHGGKIVLSNMLIWGNRKGSLANNLYVLAGTHDTVIDLINHTLIEGNSLIDARDEMKLPKAGTVNIDATGLKSEDIFVAYKHGNFRLRKGSPAIDKGDNSTVKNIITDKDNQPRIVNDIVDIGAYEYMPEK